MTTSTETATRYFGIPDEFASAENARVSIVPVPYEATVSYGQGTSKGPEAVLEASQQVELFDDELWIEPYKVGIHTADAVRMDPVLGDNPEPFKELTQAVQPLIEFDKFPIIIGGEHSLTLGSVKACLERYPDLSILQIDAHADCRDSYEGNPYSHASISYHLYKALPQPLITQVGIRNISAGEVEWMEQEKPQINIFWARQQEKWNFQDIVNTLSDNVYLTIDIDGLDSSIMPTTGTPEPGGMTWYQTMALIKQLCIKKNVVAADIVEFAPVPNFHAPTFLVAKLIYKLIGYRFALELGVSKKYL
jgi:agmatinase